MKNSNSRLRTLTFDLSTTKPTTAAPGSSVTTPLRGAEANTRRRTAAISKAGGAKVDNSRASGKIKKYSSPNKQLLTLFTPKYVLRFGDKKIPIFSSSALKSKLKLKVSRFRAIQQMFNNSAMDLFNQKLKHHEIKRWSYMVGLECSNGK
jgi:hypothetical protein